ncbi:hypothetical protein [Stenotrophomonas beteli]|uniref:Transmembrane protein n=1 Tax=Stenotrophomonas beteli TaxID=3384461 RepID=A0A0R0BFU6_9GAMM|nr:hypothetical protein [Stenotrophomonas maltophilia]KRG52401.1 hypothetical protein ARC23_06310 [Stenotrophomonas maltophilia]
MPNFFQKPTTVQVFWLSASVVWLLLAFALIHAGFKPDYWQLRHIESGTLPYPTDSVFTFALIILVEIVVLGLIVQPWRFHRLWPRMFVCALPWLGWTVLWSVTAMHQSPVRDVHLNWVLAVAALLLVALLVVVPASACPRLRRWLNG